MIMATLVGHGKGVVVATGEQTEFGVIFTMMQDVSLLVNLPTFEPKESKGRGETNPPTTFYGPARKKAINSFFRDNWGYLFNRCFAEAALARDVYHRRFVQTVIPGVTRD